MVDVGGNAAPVAQVVTKLGPVGSVPVTTSATALTPAGGTPLRPATVTSSCAVHMRPGRVRAVAGVEEPARREGHEPTRGGRAASSRSSRRRRRSGDRRRAVNRFSCPPVDTATRAVLGTVWPGVVTFKVEVNGRGLSAGHAVTKPGAVAWVMVTFTTAATAPAGTCGPRLTVRVPPAGTRPAGPPMPRRVSSLRAGGIETSAAGRAACRPRRRHDAADLAVVARVPELVADELQLDDRPARCRPGRDDAHWPPHDAREREDAAADEVGVEVGAVVAGPGAVGHEGSAGDGLAARRVGVGVEGVLHRAAAPGSRRPTSSPDPPCTARRSWRRRARSSISSHSPWPTSLMKNRAPAAFGSGAMRKGFRTPKAKISRHTCEGAAEPVLHATPLPAPANGLPGAGSPLDVIRRIFPDSRLRSWAALLAPEQPLSPRGSQPLSPTAT